MPIEAAALPVLPTQAVPTAVVQALREGLGVVLKPGTPGSEQLLSRDHFPKMGRRERRPPVSEERIGLLRETRELLVRREARALEATDVLAIFLTAFLADTEEAGLG